MVRILEQTALVLATLQQAVIRRRFQQRLTDKAFSKQGGLQPQMLKDIEQNRLDKLDFLSLQKIANALTCNLSELLETPKLLSINKRLISIDQPQNVRIFFDRLNHFSLSRKLMANKLRKISDERIILRDKRLASCSQRDQLLLSSQNIQTKTSFEITLAQDY